MTMLYKKPRIGIMTKNLYPMKKILILFEKENSDEIENVKIVLKKYYLNYSFEKRLLWEGDEARSKLIHSSYWDVVILWRPSFKTPVFLGWFSQFDTFQSMLITDDIENMGAGFTAGIQCCVSPVRFFDESIFSVSSRFFRDPNLN